MHVALHGLRRALECTNTGVAGAFDEYERFGVTPVMVHRPREDHHKAVLLLTEGLTRAVGRPVPDLLHRWRGKVLL
jgi:hypothetical protein